MKKLLEKIFGTKPPLRKYYSSNDVRRNYFQAGSIWNSPLPNDGSDPSSSIDNHIAGTVRLSNATMETYTQATSNNISNPVGVGLNCFSCHNRGVNNITGA